MRAQFPGRCEACEERIHEGDEMTFRPNSPRSANGTWVHLHCPEPVEEKPAVVCDRCWLTKPCGCEDPS
jgi:hypothetical protein